MKVVIVLVALATVAMAFDRTEEWEDWKKSYNKEYPSESEELYRRAIWLSNTLFIEDHNSRNTEYTVAMNEFGDLDPKEFEEIYNGYSHKGDGKGHRGEPFVPTMSVGDLPDTVDWRTKGYVTPIKNQGQCGSCWAFSATGSLEGQHFNVTGNLVSLSEQNLVDCSQKQGNEGCNGGLPDYAFEYVISNGGIDTEASYPYVGRDETCRYNAANIGSTCKGYVDITKDSESDLQVASATVGPISVGIDASGLGFQFYHSGVYHSYFCSQTNLDHGVLVVGYGEYEGSTDYWLVKNSWGTSWGIEGYIMMSRNRDNNCGIASEASYPIVEA